MAIDSSANLLFNISADPSAAQSNIAAFRGLLSKDLSAMGAEFSDWAGKVFGGLATVQGAMTAGAATLAAGAVAAISVMSAAGDKWVSYVSEIAKASKVTGIGVEDMSRLAEAAETTGVPLDAVTRGLGFLYANISKANQGSEKQIEMFRRQGIGAQELAAAEKNPLPVLMKLADAFHDNASAVQKAGIGREEFGRGWTELLPLLSRGSAAIREMGDTINGTSKIVTNEAVIAAREYKTAVRELKEQHEALNYTIGRESMPLLMQWAVAQATAAKMAVEAVKAPMDTLKGMFVANLKGVATLGLWPVAEFVLGFRREMAKMEADAKRLAKLGTEKGTGEFLPTDTKPEEAAKETKQEFYGLSSIVETLRGHMAGLEGDEAKVLQQAQRFRIELQKAEDALFDLAAKKKITPAVFEREFAAMKDLPKLILGFSEAELQAVLEKRTEERTKEIEKEIKQEEEAAERRKEAILLVGADLQEKLVSQEEDTWQQREALLEAHIRRLAEGYEKQGGLDEKNAERFTAFWQASYRNLAREQAAATAEKLRSLQSEAAAILSGGWTTVERLKWQYDQDLLRFNQVEEAKTLKLIEEGPKREALERQYELNRQAALTRYQEELNVFRNSQGWQGVFGDHFAQNIRGNETLLREWSTSSNQALMMVEVATESLREIAVQAFGQFAQAMGQDIAQAIIYKKEMGAAMRATATEALASLASRAIAEAIFSTAFGFMCLAMGNFSGAAHAFTAAAMYGTVGTVAAIAGRAIAPKQGAAGAAGGAGEGVSGGGSAAGASQAQEARKPQVNIYIQGPVVGRYGIDELAEMLNEAVQGRDVKLISSGTKNNTRLLR